MKLAGQCGKLKCCLNYELDSYLDALKEFPKNDKKLLTEKGTAFCIKIDIFKGVLWYAYEGKAMNWFMLSAESANQIIAMNKKGEKAASIEEYVEDVIVPESKIFSDVVGQDSLTRFDKPKSKKNNNKNRNNRNRNRNRNHKKDAK